MQSEVEAPVGPRRTHPLTVVGGFALFAMGLLLDTATQGVGIQTVITLFGGLQMAQWWFKTYELGPDELVVREGVLRRRQHVVPYRRVQQIDVRRSLLMQVFGLAALSIETAGSQEGSVNLSLLDLTTAARVRAIVLARRAEALGASASTSASEPDALHAARVTPEIETSVFEIAAGQLLLAGLLSPAPVMVAAVAVALSPVALAASTRIGFLSLAIIAGAALLVAVLGLLSAVVTALGYGGYRLAVAGDDLRLTHGVLDKKHVTIPRARVQHIRIVDNPAQRMLGYASIHVRSAARVGRGNEGTGNLDIPIVRRAVIPQFVAGLMGNDEWTPPPLQPRPPVARRRAIIRRTALLLVVAVGAAFVTPVAGLAGVVVAVVIGWWWGRAAHRRAGSGVTNTVTALAAGVVVNEMHLVPIARIQSARTIQSPFQRRADLATIALDIAGAARAPALYDADARAASELRRTLPLRSRAHASTTT